MPTTDDRKSPPIVLVLVAALLGVYALPRTIPSGDSAPKPAPAKTDADAVAAKKQADLSGGPTMPKNPDLAILAPLLELSDDGSRRRIEDGPNAPKFDGADRKAVVREIVRAVAPTRG